MERITSLFSQLPILAQQQVLEFVAFLVDKYTDTSTREANKIHYPLKGSVLQYEDPFGPASTDWEA